MTIATGADTGHPDSGDERDETNAALNNFQSTEEFYCRPFVNGAPLWREKGWLGTIPLPAKSKNPPPVGWTGRAAGFPDDEQTDDWSSDPAYAKGNLGLHLGWPVTVNGVEYEVIGIDVDHYLDNGKQKLGGDQLAALERQYGPLPPTVVSTARARNDDGSDRGDWISGVRFFLVPRGLAFRGQAAADIEVIQKNHRFVVVWPSWNPKSETTYRLYSPTQWADRGQALDPVKGDKMPCVTELPVLPTQWVDYLTNGKVLDHGQPIDTDSSVAQVYQWAGEQFNDGDRDAACVFMCKTVDKWCERIETEATSHDKIRDAHWEILNLAAEGCTGWRWAIEHVGTFWADDVSARDKRDHGGLTREAWRSESNALRKIKARTDQARKSGARYTPDYCLHSDYMKSTGTSHVTTTAPVPLQAKFTDSGLADAIATEVLRGQFLRLTGGNSWLQWDGQRWKNLGKEDGPVVEAIRQYVLHNVADAAIRAISDPAAQPEVDAWKKIASKARIRSVLDLARNLVTVELTGIDAEPYLLNTPNGTYDLHSCEFLPHDPDNRITRITTGAYYEPGDSSVSKLPRYGVRWNNFLNEILPEPSTRKYLQKVMGMALVGRLKEKKLFIFNGSGDNGKNVFWEAIHFALGDSQTGGYGAISRSDILETDGKDRQLLEMKLATARVAFISETDKKIALAEGIVKKLTGDKLITARTLYSEPVTLMQSATVVLITNKLPNFSGGDVAMRNRLRVIPFSVCIPEEEQDKGLGEALELEADAVLTWLIDGYCEYLQDGLEEPLEVEDATALYHRENDIVGQAIAAVCTTESGRNGERKAVKDAIVGWLHRPVCPEGRGIKVSEVVKALEERGHVALPKSNGVIRLAGIDVKRPEDREVAR